jgi:hypothetical protein
MRPRISSRPEIIRHVSETAVTELRVVRLTTNATLSFVTLLIAAVWLAGTGLAVTWWGGGAIGRATLRVASGAAGLALRAALSG